MMTKEDMTLNEKTVDKLKKFKDPAVKNNMPPSSFFYHDVSFFSHPRHPCRIHPWIHTNFSEDGYAYFVSLGLKPHDAIHLASSNVNAVTFRKEAQKASAGCNTQPEVKEAQLNYLRKQIKELTLRGGWKDDLQHCIHDIARAIKSEKPWGDHVRETKEIGIGERFVYMIAVEHAEELKKIEEEQLVSQNPDKHNRREMDFVGSGDMPLDDSNVCTII